MYKLYGLLLLLPLHLFSSCSEATERNTDANNDALEASSLSTSSTTESSLEKNVESNTTESSEEDIRQPDELTQDMQEMTKSTPHPSNSSSNERQEDNATDKTTTTGQTKKPPKSSSSSSTSTAEEGASSSNTRSTTSSKPKEQPSTSPRSLSHDTWNQLLSKHVSSSGKVDYRGFQRDKQQLAAYLEHLAENPPQNWSRDKEMAYWINLYNAATVQLIVQHYPVESITKLDNGKPWDVRRVRSGPQMYTLNQIEKDKLLKRFGEPRVHFAVNCAAASCPPLLNKAWTEGNIQRYFDSQTKSFINNERYNRIQPRKLDLSKIFDWYKSDFDGVVGFVQRYAKEPIKDNARISYLEYDWSLND